MADIMAEVLRQQLELQRESFGIDPTSLEGNDRAEYARWNCLALTVELGEALQEISWKPWASAEFFHREAFLGELIDALHFWTNLALLATDRPEELLAAYQRKHDINAQRQAEGYSGLNKCIECGREL
jgi:dimeric dUTPase (all-alpha-NTP-PPase superfamily)